MQPHIGRKSKSCSVLNPEKLSLILVKREKRKTSVRETRREIDTCRYYDEVEDANSNVEKQNKF